MISKPVPTDLRQFAYFPNWSQALMHLTQLALPERWSFNLQTSHQYPILKYYLLETFKLIASQRNQMPHPANKIIVSEDVACFNTGLFSRQYSNIYALFYANQKSFQPQPWIFKAFTTEKSLHQFSELPVRVTFYHHITDLVYNPELPVSLDFDPMLNHSILKLLSSYTSCDVKKALDQALRVAINKIKINNKLPIPHYYDGQIRFLLPLSFQEDTIDLALSVILKDSTYHGTDLLPLEIAYQSARLISPLDDHWLC